MLESDTRDRWSPVVVVAGGFVVVPVIFVVVSTVFVVVLVEIA